MQTHRPHLRRWLGATLIFPSIFLTGLRAACAAQTASEDTTTLRRILERLDRLEEKNRELTAEVGTLRQELAQTRGGTTGPAPAAGEEAKSTASLAERMDVQERRVEEMAQSKVESSQHFPIRITGMALFNSYINSHSDTPNVPTLAESGGVLTGGATLRQTILGLDFQGPEIFAGGKIHGFLNMDFFGSAGSPYTGAFRIRTGGIEFNWENTTVMVGQDKPLISPRQPNSLAQVWLAPLTDSGNLWVWQPQLRVEQRFHLDPSTTLSAQGSLFETREGWSGIPPAYGTIQTARPSIQGRFALAHNFDDTRRFEFGTGFAASTTHVSNIAVPSRVFSLDWFANPWRKLEFSGAFFHGQDVTNLGGVGIGYTILGPYSAIPVHADGGWAQLSFLATSRLTFNLFGGEQQNRGRDLALGDVARNQTLGGNLMYRIAPNVIISLESDHLRSRYLGGSRPLNNHYDLGVAYLF